jgi:predicted amidophosphoribosyltransferase
LLRKFSHCDLDIVAQKHALLVQSLCESTQFRRLLRRLSKNENKSSISKALAEASRCLLDENTHLPRPRLFIPSQLARLEATFAQTKYIGKQLCVTLAQDLQIGECEVRQWFARRRMKFKRQSRNLIIQAAIPPALLAAIAG